MTTETTGKENEGCHEEKCYGNEDEGSMVGSLDVSLDVDENLSTPLEILLQFIPYYGQGDPSNDSIVRSTLSNMSVEDIDMKDSYGNTLLLLACQYRCEDLARLMLNKGANPLSLNSGGASCLHFVCYKDTLSINIVKALLQNGANPEVQEATYGCTPLHYAAQSGDISLCKMLLASGGIISSVDQSNYTCVDYAKWEEKHECAAFLQERLDKFNRPAVSPLMYGVGVGIYGAGGGGVYGGQFGGMGIASQGGGFPPPVTPLFNSSEWAEYEDPDSLMKYYVNVRTGETLWEQDYLAKAAAAPRPGPPPLPAGAAIPTGSISPEAGVLSSTVGAKPKLGLEVAAGPVSMGGIRHSFYGQHPALKAEADLEYEAFKLRVMAFFNKHAPARIGETESLLQNKYKGSEFDLIRDLCSQYSCTLDPEVAAYQVTLKELQTEHLNKSGSAVRPGMISPKPPSRPVSAAVARPGSAMCSPAFRHSVPPSPLAASMGIGMVGVMTPLHTPNPGVDESVVQAMLSELRAKHEAQVEEERAGFRKILATKDGALVAVQGELDGAVREKASVMEAKAQLEDKMSRSQSQGGEALAKSEGEISRLQEVILTQKDELSGVRQELTYDKEKLQSAELMIANMASGHEETIVREKAAAEERAAQMREKEEHHAQEMRDVEGLMRANDVRAKYDLATAKSAWERQEADLRSTHDAAKRVVEDEVEAVRRELTALKAKSAQELSAAQMEIDDLKRANEELLRRAEAAEAGMREMQAELQEARAVQQYNAQLHKDLTREQLQRKRLHNEIEDMKGKIRVYVRVRPFSTSEKSRGCTEAVTKDGKLSVLVKGANGPDSKKNYDFDNVFAGAEGNTQADIFRDTKHLMLSVIDGYNVCIFAYGQTGAGKSFTMIGAADIGDCLKENGEFDELAGITPRAVSELFRLLNERQAQVSTEVEVQMFQLYRDGLDDLLLGGVKKKRKDDLDDADKPALKITLAEHSPTGLVQVEGAVSMVAETPGDVMRIFAKGAERRTTASTQMNAESSRSHLICCLVVKLTNRRTGAETIGKLTLVDLAGSERVDKSGAMGEVLKEAQSINKSLSALGDVIAALTSGQQHIPYRNHPLTMLMSDSLGGNAKTLMFVNTSPADYNVAESNSSLGFASRCKDITNSVAAGPGVQAAQMMALKKELAKLKKSGSSAAGAGGAKAGGTKLPPIG